MKTFIVGVIGWVVVCLVALGLSTFMVSLAVNTGIDIGASLSTPEKPVYATKDLDCIVCGNYKVSTKQVQKTQSSAMLHELSVNVEITPVEMLGSGQLDLAVQ